MTGIRSRWPATVLVFLGYAVLLLAVAAIVIRLVIDQAINAPVSPIGLVWMVLLGCTVFTVSLTLQRKQAARNPALGLSPLPIPLAVFLLFAADPAVAIVPLLRAAVLLVALARTSGGACFGEP